MPKTRRKEPDAYLPPSDLARERGDEPASIEEDIAVGDELYCAEPPCDPFAPTEARPGTSEKIDVMRERVRRGQSPFHPDDAR